MGLKPCPQCQHVISDAAASCPSCGHPLAKIRAQKSQRTGCLLLLAFPFVLVAMGGFLNGFSPTETPSAKAVSTCSQDWKVCSDNADLMNSNNLDALTAQSECKDSANEQAKYGDPKWPWLAFSKFYRGSAAIKTGVLTLVEDDVQFQNGFGAWAHVTAVCDYDLRSKSVKSVSIIPKE
jgi:hypothetical protein